MERNEMIKNSINEKQELSKTFYKKISIEENRRIYKEQKFNFSYFKENPIKQDIEKEKILIENLHIGIDN